MNLQETHILINADKRMDAGETVKIGIYLDDDSEREITVSRPSKNFYFAHCGRNFRTNRALIEVLQDIKRAAQNDLQIARENF